MKRLVMVIIGVVVIICVARLWLWPLIEDALDRQAAQRRDDRIWQDWRQGDTGR